MICNFWCFTGRLKYVSKKDWFVLHSMARKAKKLIYELINLIKIADAKNFLSILVKKRFLKWQNLDLTNLSQKF